MDFENLPLTDLIRLRQNGAMPHIVDVELGNVKELRKFNSVECHLVLYPYCREVSSDDFTFSPYEEYVADVTAQNRSAYIKRGMILDKLFGIFLGIAVVMIHIIIGKEPIALFDVEPLIAIFGAYVIGKELWEDLDRLLINVTKKWKLRYTDDYYSYQLEKGTTLARYSTWAKKNRYGKATIPAERMDFIRHSNSETVRMWFSGDDFWSFEEDSLHILSIHLAPEIMDEFNSAGFMLGIKLSFNRATLFSSRSTEVFQSMSRNDLGCLDAKGDWIDNGIFYRKTSTFGRIKHFYDSGVKRDIKLIDNMKTN
ncbi:MAG: hypothetical protein JXR97_00520 [Planctomycetes bacterium]|nr:hypothetical protein [Planctomycetota bacterium]